MEYTLPLLPYAYDDLEPHIDAQTMEIHYTKHHQTYVNKLNDALISHSDLQVKSLETLFIELPLYPHTIAAAIRNNGGGHWNHSFFWKLMKKNGDLQPQKKVAELITKNFGNFIEFQKKFCAAALTVFGSGWAWLCVDSSDKLTIMITANQDNPLMEKKWPIFGIDVWEHAYYLKYQNRRPDYINAWWNVVNWEQVEKNYTEFLKK